MNSSDCCNVCGAQLPPVNIVGSTGATGAAGADGSNGVNSFSLTTADFVIPPFDGVTTVNVSVSSSLWCVVGQDVIIGQGLGAALPNPGPGTFRISAIPSASVITCIFLKGQNDAAAGSTISTGAVVSPSGLPALPITIAQGGTGQITVPLAQTALGLGQNTITSNNSGLTQALTNTMVQIGTIDVQLPATGTPWLWQLQGWVSIDWSGVSAATRTLTFKIRNVTQAVDIITKVIHTQAMVTLTFPTTDFYLQASDPNGAVNDHYQLMIGSDGPNPPNTAGTWQIIAANLEAIPLRKLG